MRSMFSDYIGKFIREQLPGGQYAIIDVTKERKDSLSPYFPVQIGPPPQKERIVEVLEAELYGVLEEGNEFYERYMTDNQSNDPWLFYKNLRSAVAVESGLYEEQMSLWFIGRNSDEIITIYISK